MCEGEKYCRSEIFTCKKNCVPKYLCTNIFQHRKIPELRYTAVLIELVYIFNFLLPVPLPPPLTKDLSKHQVCWILGGVMIINPQRACAARVTVVVPCVCVCVCLFVVFCHHVHVDHKI